jgi:hypothetical protein
MEVVKKRWRWWRSKKKPSVSKFEDLKKTRQRTDQLLKQQEAEKKQPDAPENEKPP